MRRARSAGEGSLALGSNSKPRTPRRLKGADPGQTDDLTEPVSTGSRRYVLAAMAPMNGPAGFVADLEVRSRRHYVVSHRWRTGFLSPTPSSQSLAFRQAAPDNSTRLRDRGAGSGRKWSARAPRSTPASRAIAANLSVERNRASPPFTCALPLTNRSAPNLRKRGARSISPRNSSPAIAAERCE